MTRFPAFLGFWLTILTVVFFITRSSEFDTHPDLLAMAVTVDVVLLVPLVYLLLARRFGWRWISVVPVLVVSIVAANLLIPAEHQRWLHGIELALAPLELLLIGFLIHKVRAVRQGLRKRDVDAEDFLEVLEVVLMHVTDTIRPAKIMATEVAMIYYGLTGWWRKPVDRPGRTAFSYHRSNSHGTVMAVFLFLIAVETAVLHWLLLPRIAWLAWIVFALSVYSCVFLLADLNAARLRPLVVEEGVLTFRVALRWRAAIALSAIERAEPNTLDIDDKDGLLAAPLVGNQDVILHLTAPHSAIGLYGFRKEFDRLALSVDDVQGFAQALSTDVNGGSGQVLR
jgi:hypothetical protein